MAPKKNFAYGSSLACAALCPSLAFPIFSNLIEESVKNHPLSLKTVLRTRTYLNKGDIGGKKKTSKIRLNQNIRVNSICRYFNKQSRDLCKAEIALGQQNNETKCNAILYVEMRIHGHTYTHNRRPWQHQRKASVSEKQLDGYRIIQFLGWKVTAREPSCRMRNLSSMQNR